MREFEVKGRSVITVYPVSNGFGTSRTKQVEVSWSAIGSVDVATAKEFVKKLQEAIQYAESIA